MENKPDIVGTDWLTQVKIALVIVSLALAATLIAVCCGAYWHLITASIYGGAFVFLLHEKKQLEQKEESRKAQRNN